MRKFALFLVLFLIPCVSAKYITVSVMPLSGNFVTDISGELNYSVSNLGDEPAYDMSLGLLTVPGFYADKVYLGIVNNGVSRSVSFRLNVSEDVLPGEYYMNLVVQYADANGYPFSMVNPVKVVYKKPVQSRVTGFMEKVSISGDSPSVLKLVLNNNDEVQRDVKVNLNAPNEISIDSSSRSVSIPAKGSVTVDFKVSSIGALPGSRYVVFAVVDYSDDVHYSTAARANVEINEKGDLLGSIPGWAPVVVLALLVLLVVAVQLLARKPKRKNK